MTESFRVVYTRRVLSGLLRQASLEVFHLRLLMRQRGGRRAAPSLLTRKTDIRDWLADRIRELQETS